MMAKVNEFIAHYADANYDPQKAHEYYLKRRELEGRQPKKKPNRYSAQQRKEGNAYLTAQARKNSEELNAKIEALEKKAKQARDRIIQKMANSLSGATEMEMKSVSVGLKSAINKVRGEYAAARKNLAKQREQLNS